VLATHDPPLTVTQYLALTAIADEPLTAAELARRTSVSPGAVSQLVAGLEAARLVQRAAADADRRRQPLVLTEAGHRALASAQRLMTERLGPLLGDLAGPEAEALARLLARVERLVAGAPPPPPPRRPPRP